MVHEPVYLRAKWSTSALGGTQIDPTSPSLALPAATGVCRRWMRRIALRAYRLVQSVGMAALRAVTENQRALASREGGAT